MRKHQLVTLVALLLGASAPAAACPSCAAGQAARSDVWADGFFYNLAAAALPFVVVGAVGAGLHGVGRPRRRALGMEHPGSLRGAPARPEA